MKRTVLEYDVSIRDVLETPEGYSCEKAKEVLEGNVSMQMWAVR